MSAPRRILIVNPFGIGDVLFSTPVVRAVRRAFPESFIGYLCNRRTERILRTNPHVNELFVYEKDELVRLWQRSRRESLLELWQLVRGVRRARFELVIDLSLGERYGFLLKWLGVPRRAGFDYHRRGRFLTERLPIDGYNDMHVVEYYRCLLRFLGVEMLDSQLELRRTDEDERWADACLARYGLQAHQRLVGLVPAGGVSWGIDAPFRRWSFEGFAQIGDALARRFGARVLLFGEASDRSVCGTVARLMQSDPIDLSGQTSLGQFVSLLSRLALVICNDGGPLHLAVSQRIRTVSVFGPVDPDVYGPYPRGAGHQIVCKEELPCRPCYRQFRLPPCPYERACLTALQPDDVFKACETVLKDLEPARAGTGEAGR